jgi:hypothetical protein
MPKKSKGHAGDGVQEEQTVPSVPVTVKSKDIVADLDTKKDIVAEGMIRTKKKDARLQKGVKKIQSKEDQIDLSAADAAIEEAEKEGTTSLTDFRKELGL